MAGWRDICASIFDLLQIGYSTWSRRKNTQAQLSQCLAESSHVLLLISDSAIESFIKTLDSHGIKQHRLIHFSGCIHTSYAVSAHPLQTFTNELYPLAMYQKIPFIVEAQSLEFKDLFPALPNPHYTITHEDKAYYHALCVMANNFSSILWRKFFKTMQSKFGISRDDLLPFLHQTQHNISQNDEAALTGPLIREDVATIQKNLSALNDDPFRGVYQVFSQLPLKELYDEKHF